MKVPLPSAACLHQRSQLRKIEGIPAVYTEREFIKRYEIAYRNSWRARVRLRVNEHGSPGCRAAQTRSCSLSLDADTMTATSYPRGWMPGSPSSSPQLIESWIPSLPYHLRIAFWGTAVSSLLSSESKCHMGASDWRRQGHVSVP